MAKTRCIFCGSIAARSKEHVWPLWLQEAVDAQDHVAAWVHRSIVGGAVSRRVQNTASIVLGQVCSSCNNGWMSELESRVAPIVQALLREVSSTTLSAEDAGLLALWAFKTAIALNAASNYRRIVPDEHFRLLYSNREVPPWVVVDAAHLRSNQRLTSAQSQHFVGVVKGDTQRALSLIETSGYNIVLGVGSVAFRVAHLPVPEHVTVADVELPNRTKRLWPSAGGIVLNRELGFSNLRDFAVALTFGHKA